MNFLRWLGGIFIFFILIGMIFKIGSVFINILLIIAMFTFIIDMIMTTNNKHF